MISANTNKKGTLADPEIHGTASTRVYLGIDPGTNGGMALITGDRQVKYLESLKGLNCQGIWDEVGVIKDLWSSGKLRLYAVIEKVGGYRPGSKGNIGSRMFTFGATYGRIQMALKARGITWKEVTASVWQREYFSQEDFGGNSVEHKRLLKDKAKELFNYKGITLANCDALLLSEYIRRKGEHKYGTAEPTEK